MSQPSTPSERILVVPGDQLPVTAAKIDHETILRENEQYYSTVVGLFEQRQNRANVVRLFGPYTPKVGDVVVGIIIDEVLLGWKVDINAARPALLPFTNVPSRSKLSIGDVIVAEVADYGVSRGVVLNMREKRARTGRRKTRRRQTKKTRTKGRRLGRVTRGFLVAIQPSKLPRLIGRGGSMISAIKRGLNCDIIVGENGYLVLRTESLRKRQIFERIIRIIEAQAHTTGLTERVIKLLSESLSSFSLEHSSGESATGRGSGGASR